jgi:hypothetical protein
MNILKLAAFGTLASLALSMPAQAQMNAPQPNQPQPNQPQSNQQDTPESAQIGMGGQEQLPPELSQPLEVGQQQANEFFTPPPRQQPVENQFPLFVDSDTLIGPPPGSQTPAELNPTQELTVPIQ